MTRKRCVRRVWAKVDPIGHVLEGMQVTPKEKLDKLRMRELAAIESFRMGSATKHDWQAVADLGNVAEQLARDGVGPEVLAAAEKAQAALGEAHRRLKEHGKLGMTGPEVQALRELYEYADLQRISIPMADYEKAIKRAADRIRSGAADVKVFVN